MSKARKPPVRAEIHNFKTFVLTPSDGTLLRHNILEYSGGYKDLRCTRLVSLGARQALRQLYFEERGGAAAAPTTENEG